MKKPKILIVDDKKENLFTLQSILEDLLIEVDLVEATSGNDAVKMSLDIEFALILMDVQMPGMDGFAAMNLIHRSDLNKETPVIFLSAIYSDDSYKIRGIGDGAVDFISKPIVEEILVGKVNVFLLMYIQKQKILDNMNQILMLNRDLENYDRILAHDLKQPLTVIQGAISLILADDKTLSENSRRWLETVLKSSDNMLNLINEILELIKAKTLTPENKLVNPVKIIDEIRQMLEKQGGKNIQIQCPSLPEIHTQSALLSSIFRNLIGNSIKYNQNKDIQISIYYKDNPDKHTFCIQDNGIGISPEKFKSVFEPFNRGGVGEKYSGTGVGLSIVQSAIEKMGGAISIENSGGEGTTMCFQIPKVAISA